MQNPIVRSYRKARQRVEREEHRTLTPKEFLDLVDPSGQRNSKSARDYIRRLEKGERSGRLIKRRADTGGGKMYNVALRDKSGQIVDSANVIIPADMSLLDLYGGRGKSRLRKGIEEYQKERASLMPTTRETKDYRPRTSLKGLSVAGVQQIKNTRTRVGIVRRKAA